MKNLNLKIKIYPFLNALLFSIFVIIGRCFDKFGTITYLFRDFKTVFLNLFSFLVLLIVFYVILNKIYAILANYKLSEKKEYPKIINYLFYEHPFGTMMITCLLVSGIYLFIFYPGVVSFDGCWQLNSYFRIWTFNDHHPALLSILMGNLYKFGSTIANDNLGIFFYTIIQVLINSLVYAYVFKVMHKLNAPLILRVFTFIFFSMFPLWSINSITYIKDTIYYLIFLLIFVFQYYHLNVKNDFKKFHFIVLLGLYLILYIWRNTGFYLGIMMNLIFFIVRKKERFYFLTIFIFLLGFNTFYHHYFLSKMNIQESLIREKLSIPLQQTARYIKNYYDDITIEEEKGIKQVFRDYVIDIKEIGEVYEPNRSDNVKALLKDYPTKEELIAYFKTWKSMGVKHPIVYIDATINNTYGYFYSKHKNFMGEELGFYHMTSFDFDFSFSENTGIYRDYLRNFSDFLCHTPIIGLLYGCPMYIWVLIFLTGYLLAICKFKVLIYYLPLYFTVFMCLISPVNGHMRYLEPVAVSLPLAITFFLYELDKMHKEKAV